VRAPQEFARAIHIYIDLGSKAALELDIKRFVVDEIERQLMRKYSVDVYEHNFVRGVYDLEVKRFRSSFKAAIYKTNKTKLDERLMERLDELVSNKSEHSRCSIQHVARARKRQIIVMLDNADQRSADVQQAAFIIAQEMAKNWDAVVIPSQSIYDIAPSPGIGDREAPRICIKNCRRRGFWSEVQRVYENRIRLVENLGSFDISDRYYRTLAFRNYLSATWDSSGLRPDYFDWNESVREGQEDFSVVFAAIKKIAREPKRNSPSSSE
jgi:hypothetical protein